MEPLLLTLDDPGWLVWVSKALPDYNSVDLNTKGPPSGTKANAPSTSGCHDELRVTNQLADASTQTELVVLCQQQILTKSSRRREYRHAQLPPPPPLAPPVQDRLMQIPRVPRSSISGTVQTLPFSIEELQSQMVKLRPTNTPDASLPKQVAEQPPLHGISLQQILSVKLRPTPPRPQARLERMNQKSETDGQAIQRSGQSRLSAGCNSLCNELASLYRTNNNVCGQENTHEYRKRQRFGDQNESPQRNTDSVNSQQASSPVLTLCAIDRGPLMPLKK